MMRVHNVSMFGDGSYRALPWESVHGETRACPLSGTMATMADEP